MHLILGTAGHIDHGKSSLVRALTGTDPDRLPEEKARGVTIELGFAHLSLQDDHQTYELGIIDVPGHADFVNNMVSGVGALDIALFIIAADDGWMPQSEEHLHILTYLGVKRVIIAMTKSDLCDDVPFAIEVLRDELQGTDMAEAPIVPVSSTTGEGIDQLKQTLLQELKHCTAAADNGKPRLAIDRIFSPKGSGTVVTGTLTGGHVNLGDTLTLQPLGIPARVRYIQNHNQALEQAQPGMRTALNLPDLPIASPGKPGAQRGHTLTTETTGQASTTLDVLLTRLSRPIPGSQDRPLRHTETVILHHGSARCQARVILHGQNQLQPGESCLAQLRLETPVLLLSGDRIVLRDGAQQHTLAGGTILDALAERPGFRTDERAEFLQQRVQAPGTPRQDLLSLIHYKHQLPADQALPNHPASVSTIQDVQTDEIEQGSIIRHGDTLLDAPWWKQILQQAEMLIQQWHQTQPDLPSMPLEELEKSLPDCPQVLFRILPEALELKGYQRQGKGIAHSSHQLTLPEHLAADAKNILKALDQAGLQPPNKAELTPTPQAQQAMQFLIRSKEVIELDPKVVISRSSRDHAIHLVSNFLTSRGQGTASELRQELDSTRKVVMPLLEHLDAIGITSRNENYRTLQPTN
ncbi:selenocysteine-specific translation elongation factor [Verrucomicrobiaceae bacterium N1E253]|uniref:Selenocysteine-specific translation elongation factor n=1 Tax=Oceaniferula marina TaxID=2748318 RepID=A0A851GJL3_9BACT|nr:selenocysteine-specific translation elongation factor [Oceaniferula marina]NWK56061.1 selenocysteine-specific translation elongation factor [Oceaniferula marina]